MSDKDGLWGWLDQYKYDRDSIINAQKEQANKHDKLCEEYHKLRIEFEVQRGRLKLIATLSGVLGGLIMKYVPAIIKALESSPKK